MVMLEENVVTLTFLLSYIISNHLSNDFLLYAKKKCKKCLMSNKKIFSTRVDEGRIKELKHLAVDTDKSLGTLLEEAIQDIVKKYRKKAKAKEK